MAWATNEIVGVISYLLPGFVAAWVFYGLTAHPRREPFERVVEALIFTAIVHAVTTVWCALVALFFGDVGELAFRVWATIFAFVIGGSFAWSANNDWLHRLLRKAGITKRTSLPSEWCNTFNREKRHVVLHLTNGRRLFGWPIEYPDQEDSGHFVIGEAAWISDGNEPVPLPTVECLLLSASDVEMVEFIKTSDEAEGELNNGKQSAPAVPIGNQGGDRKAGRVETSSAAATAPTQEGMNGLHTTEENHG